MNLKSKLILVFLLVCIVSCSIEEDHVPFQSFVSFGLGTESDGTSRMTVSTSFPTREASRMIIKVDSSSLCPYYGINFLFQDDIDTFNTEFVSKFPFIDTFDIPRGKQIKIISSIENNPENETVCMDLGNVNIKIRY